MRTKIGDAQELGVVGGVSAASLYGVEAVLNAISVALRRRSGLNRVCDIVGVGATVQLTCTIVRTIVRPSV